MSSPTEVRENPGARFQCRADIFVHQESYEAWEGELFRLLVENVQDYAIFAVDQQGLVLSWSQGAERLLGYSASEIVGKPAHCIFTPADVARGVPEEEIAQALAMGRGDDDRWHVRKDGSWFWASGVMTPLRDQDGRLRGFAKIMRDLTHRKMQEEALAEQMRMAAFGRDIGLAMARSESLPEMLKHCAETAVRHLDAAFARIWILDEAENTLVLEASAGVDRRLDAPHSRIPVGQSTIGKIAASRRPHLAGSLQGEAEVHDPQSAEAEGIVAFAGYPLVVDERLVGVMALFARHPLSDVALEAIDSVATGIAVGADRKISEQRLREQGEWLQVTLASIGDAVIATDIGGRVTFLNPVAQQLTGWTQEEAGGRAIEEVFPIVNEQSREKVENPAGQVLRDGGIIGLANHTLLVAKDGRERPIDDSAAPIRNPNGKMVGVVLVFRDVEEKRRAERELQASEERKAAILRTALDSIITIDHQARVVDFNPAAEQMFGYSHAEAVGRDIAELIIPQRLRKSHHAGMARYLATGEAQVLNRRVELPALRADGSEFPVELAITRIATDDHPLFTAYVRDISERVHIENLRSARLAVTYALAEAPTVEDAMPAVLHAVCDGLHWDIGFFWMLDRRRNRLRCQQSWHRSGLPLVEFEAHSRERSFGFDEGLPGQVWASGEPTWISEVTGYAGFPRAELAAKEGLHSAFAVPVVVNHECVGVIEFFNQEIRKPDDDLLEMMATVAGQVGQFIERKRAEDGLREQTLIAETLNRVGRLLAAELDMESIVQVVTDEGTKLTGAEGGVFVYDIHIEPEEPSTCSTGSGIAADALTEFLMAPCSRELFHCTLRSEAVVRFDDVTQEFAEPTPDPPEATPQGNPTVRSLLAVPIVSRRGEAVGSLFLAHRRAGAFDEPHERILAGVAMQAATAIDKARLYQRTQESEQRFRQLAEQIDDVFWMLDPHKPQILYVSPAYERVSGRTRESLYNDSRSYLEAIHRDDRQRVLDAQDKYVLGDPTSLEYRVVRPDGSIRWIWDRAFPIKDQTGYVYRVAGIAEDVTERKQAEDATRFLADASTSLAAIVDYESTLQTVAGLAVPSFADLCAVDLAEPDGTLRRLAVVHVDPAKVQLVKELARSYPFDPNAPQGTYRVLRTGQPQLIQDITDPHLVEAAKDDTHLRMLRRLGLRSFMCVPLQTRNVTTGVVTFAYAESARRYEPHDLALAEELARRAAVAIENARLYAALRDADRRKDEFLAMLAHELRNPLAPIRTGLDLLAMNDEPQPETVHLMQQQVGHLVRLVDDLLDVSRIVRGRIELRREPVELSTIVRRSVDAMRPALESREQALVVKLQSQPLWLDADPVRLVQVVENLLNNASKYMDNGGRIEISTEKRKGKAVVSIQDEGIGIDLELLPDIFDLFTQSARSLDRSQGGLGIGLTLVRNLVEMHGGEVAVFSEGPGKGSRFEVSLPITRSRKGSTSVSEKLTEARGRRILVVDDNVGAAKMLTVLLKRLGPHEIEMAHDGPSTIDVAERFDPEIILLDIGLPRMDGLTVAWNLRQSGKFDDTLLVALTGYGQEEDRRRSKDAGFDEHLVKPVDVQTLRQLLYHPKLSQVTRHESS